MPLLVTKEPGGTSAGRTIRRFFLGSPGEGLDPWTELFLMEAARSQHLAEVVRPALFSGTTVLCDRFTDSTVAYQGYGRGLPLDVIRFLHRLPGLRPAPDLTLIFDLPVARGLGRARGRNALSGAFLALPTNSGHMARDTLAIVPELGINAGVQLTTHMRATIGYSFLYLSNVLRPGDQIDRTLNATQIPTVVGNPTLVGTPRPLASFRETDFWANGFNAGLEFRY